MLREIAFLALLIALVNPESFPYRPAVHLGNCTETYKIDNCREDCMSLKYKWGTCVMIPKLDGLWHPLCSCFTKTLKNLEINDDYDELLE